MREITGSDNYKKGLGVKEKSIISKIGVKMFKNIKDKIKKEVLDKIMERINKKMGVEMKR